MNSRNKKLLLILVVLMLFVSIGKETYALFTSSVSSTIQSYGTGTLKLSYSSSTINLNNSYPMSDSDGMNMGSGIITITNTGTLAYKFDVKIDVSSSSTLSNDLIKVSVDEQNPAFLSSDNNVIIRDVILNPGSSRSFSLKLWIDSSAVSSQVLGKKFVGNLTSSGVAVRNVDDSVGTVLIGNESLYNYIKNNADTTTTIDFSKTSEESSTNGIYTTTDTDSGNPVYYYRGAVDNNVLFANFCWKIIRTTETGGVKLIYNGVPTATENYEIIGQDKYSTTNNKNWPFIYNSTNNTWKSNITETEEESYIDFSGFDAGYYQLDIEVFNGSDDEIGVLLDGNSTWTNSENESDTISLELTSSSVVRVYYVKWSTSTDGSNYVEFKFKKATSNCNNTTGDETTIGSSAFNSTYDNAKYVGYMYGDSIDDTANTNDSTIKTFIDTWYQNNMTSYTSRLEDTVFCNDRSYTKSGTELIFGAYTRLETNKQPTLKCQNTRDKFTVNTSNGNGNLTYPVGLITADEVAYAGGVYASNNSSYYLDNNDNQWIFSPYYFDSSIAYEFLLDSAGYLFIYFVNDSYGARPVVSLKPGIGYSSGSGTASSPFVVNG